MPVYGILENRKICRGEVMGSRFELRINAGGMIYFFDTETERILSIDAVYEILKQFAGRDEESFRTFLR